MTPLSIDERTVAALQCDVGHDPLRQHGYVHGGLQCYLADNALTFGSTSRTAVTQVEISAVKDREEYLCSVGSGTISAMKTQSPT